MIFFSEISVLLVVSTFASSVLGSPVRQTQRNTHVDKRSLFPNNFPQTGVNATYDYIVVGGGTAGLAVAYRLAESGLYSVAVVEAGGFYEIENGNVSVVPGLDLAYDGFTKASANVNPLVDWGFLTTPQAPLNNRTLHYSRGKTLGGSSAENAMIYNRGTVGSFDLWAQSVNDSTWTFDAILPYFVKGINYTLASATLRAPNATVPTPSNTTFNSTGGPMHVSYNNFALPFASWAQLGFRDIGIPDVQDFMGGKLLGSQYAPIVLDPEGEVRSSSEEAYLQTAFATGRTNLKVYTHTLAKRIIFSNAKINGTRRAQGVEVVSGSWGNENTYVLSANKEIILSAGAFQSPQLLMVSGIGSKATLKQHNISMIANRPGVGQNMWDHFDIEVTYEVNVDTFNRLNDVAFATKAAADWNSNPSTGILTSSGADYIGWEKLPNRTALGSRAVKALAAYPSDWPEVEYEIASVYKNTSNALNYATAVVIGVAPISRGTVTISSNSMLDPPIINPNWLADPTDQKVAIEAVKRMRQLFRSEAVAPIVLSDGVAPTDAMASDAQILEYIRETGFMNWHAACTCKMGKTTDPMAVVDSKARVIGVSALRIVDASSFALLTPGHPLSTLYVFAEKASADILGDA